MSSEGVFVPFSLEAVQTIEKLDVIYVEFVRTYANDGTWK